MMIGYDTLNGSRTVFFVWQELGEEAGAGGKYANNFHTKQEVTGPDDTANLCR